MKPTLHVVTHGSRSHGVGGRLSESGRLARDLGLRQGAVWGPLHDVELYRALLEGDPAPAIAVAEALAQALVEESTEQVLVDAWEGYSPAHDLTHAVARAAATVASGRSGRAVEVLEFAVAPRAAGAWEPAGRPHAAIALTPGELAGKAAACAAYAGVDEEFAAFVPEELSTEVLRRPLPLDHLVDRLDTPLYERFGEARVRAGVYAHAIRAAHVRAVAGAVQAWSGAHAPSADRPRRHAPAR